MRLRPLLACVLVTACGELPSSGEDAGLRVDAGSFSYDAGEAADGGASDAGPADAAVPGDAGMAFDAGPPPDAGRSVLRYPAGRTQSPLTAEVVVHLQAIEALSTTRRLEVFSKVGDSNTVNANYLACFPGNQVDLGARSDLQPALQHFRAGQVAGTTGFDRTSQAAAVGWSASAAIAGSPSPLQQELDAAQPRFATVAFGTNDVGAADTHSFGRNLFTIIDTLSMQGVVPIVSSVPPRDDSAAADAWVPRYNLVARGVAQARRVPFVDIHRELQSVPAHGLGPDGVHLNVYTPTGARGCVLNAAGLGFGHNARNLATLDALSRAWGALASGTAPDTSAPRINGSGLPGDEVQITSLPFVDVRDTRVDGLARIDAYPGCAAAANESGREVLYRLVLAQPTNVRMFVVSLGGADIDVHLLSDPNSGQACVARNDKVLVRQLAAGTHWLALDTFQSATGVLAGEYLLGVLPE